MTSAELGIYFDIQKAAQAQCRASGSRFSHLAQRCLDEALGILGQPGRKLWLALEDVVIRGQARAFVEGSEADHQLVSQDADRPDVHLGVSGFRVQVPAAFWQRAGKDAAA